MNPELTIVVPMYGVEKYIVRCLESIYRNPEAIDRVEILLIDDGSPDKSAEIARQWLEVHKFPNAQIIHQENRGLGGARNTGIRRSKAPWIWFIDSDDEIMPDALSNILSRLNPQLDFLIFNYLNFPQNQIGYDCKQVYEDIKIETIASLFPINSPCFNIYRKDFLTKNELFFREKFLHEDNEMAIRVNFRAQKVAFYPIVIYKYYLYNIGSITNTTVSPKKIHDLLMHFRTYELLCTENPTLLQQRAMQQINSIVIHWLLRYLYMGTASDIAYTSTQITENRSSIMNAICRLPMKYRLKIWLETNPFLIKYRVLRLARG